MTYAINPALVRRMAGEYDAAVSPLAGYDFPATRVAADTFGHVELAAWFAAVGDQLDEAGRALHTGVTTMAGNLRYAADDAENTDTNAAATYVPPPGLESGLGMLLDPNRPPTPGQSRYGGPL